MVSPLFGIVFSSLAPFSFWIFGLINAHAWVSIFGVFVLLSLWYYNFTIIFSLRPRRSISIWILIISYCMFYPFLSFSYSFLTITCVYACKSNTEIFLPNVFTWHFANEKCVFLFSFLGYETLKTYTEWKEKRGK